MNTLVIPIEKPTTEFQKHLELDNNNRILFSGMFGMGKTYFLDKFFNEPVNSSKYNYIHLLPVHYSVSSNEDIFEYIKYDIASRLLANENIKLDSNALSRSLHHSLYLYSKPADILSPLLKFIPIIGNASAHVYDRWMDLAKEMDEDYKSKSKGEVEILKDYTSNTINKIGTIYENDFYTLLIKKLLESWVTNTNKQNVLVIDDLDRIDPEHIFRLFNVFGAHASANIQESFDNKFGFDKIIFVCDIENIRNIFSSRYGDQVDFNGYIDKFYSNEIFYYQNRTAIIQQISKIVKTLRLTSSIMPEAQIESYNYTLSHFSKLTEILLSVLIYNSSINLRSILKKYNKGIEYTSENFLIPKGAKTSGYNLPITLLIYVFNNLIGDEISFVEFLSKAENQDPTTFGMDKEAQIELISLTIHIADINQNNLALKSSNYKSDFFTFGYLVRKENSSRQFYSDIITINDESINNIDGNFRPFEILKQAIVTLNKYRIKN